MMISGREKKEGREEGRQEEGTEEERSGQMKGGSRAEWLPLVCALDVLIHINHHFYQLDSKDLFSNAFQQNSICLLCSTTYFQASLCSRSIMHTLCSPGSYHFISAVSVCLSVCLSPLPLVHNNPLNIRKTIAAELAVICPPPPSLKPALSCNQSRRLARSPLRPSPCARPRPARVACLGNFRHLPGCAAPRCASAFPPLGLSVPSIVETPNLN